MGLSDRIAPHLPHLRRYGRALTGAQASGDAYVRATLEAMIADTNLVDEEGDIRAQLYHIFQKIWSTSAVAIEPDGHKLTKFEALADARLQRVTPVARQALLLSAMEGFSVSQVAHIMDRADNDIETLLGDALSDVEKQPPTKVLVIEDEPLIALDLEQIVESLGHSVTTVASTREEAVTAAKREQPGLVLADIQLADNSSGIDAVKDILSDVDVPVIFITAFPDRLLTGERPEPTFLVTKPFQESTVKAAIGQALFFGADELAA